MSIFDYLVPKAADGQKRKQFSPTPYRKLASALDAAAEEARARYPEDGEAVQEFAKALKETCKARCRAASASDQPPLNAAAQLFLTKDRMSAYGCLLPPENGGEGIAWEGFLEEMRCEGISCGILEEEIRRELELGYLRIFPAARGTLPQPGEDGGVTELFPRCGCVRLGEQTEFRQDLQPQLIRRGTAICQIQLPAEGTDGSDVTGRVLPCPRPGAALIPQGENTAVSGDGQALTAGADGVLYFKDGLFCVRAQRIAAGGSLRGPLKVSGDLCIEGDVDGGAVVEASGDIVISGKLGAARVTSVGGTIRVQQGVCGVLGRTVLNAARQVQSPVMERAEISAGTDVVAERIANCTIHCDGTVYAATGRGMISGSLIRAGGSILCLRIGNLAGERSQFSVGYPPHSPESWNQLRTELTQAKATIKKLWATITDLRKKGAKITDMEKSVLDQLVEQRTLYIEKRESLTAELSILDEVLNKKSNGRIQCEELHPPLEVQIGRSTLEITSEEENCSIHVTDNRIFLR